MKLSIRIRTTSGTRTLVTSGHDAAFAHAIKQALDSLAVQAMDHDAIYAEVTEEGASISMREHMRRRKMAAVKAAARVAKSAETSNVENFAAAKKKKARS